MFTVGEIELIDRDELIEAISKSDCHDREKIIDLILSRPIIAKAKHRYEIEVY